MCKYLFRLNITTGVSGIKPLTENQEENVFREMTETEKPSYPGDFCHTYLQIGTCQQAVVPSRNSFRVFGLELVRTEDI